MTTIQVKAYITPMDVNYTSILIYVCYTVILVQTLFCLNIKYLYVIMIFHVYIIQLLNLFCLMAGLMINKNFNLLSHLLVLPAFLFIPYP